MPSPDLEARMRDLLAKASVIGEAGVQRIDSEKTSSGKADAVVPRSQGTSLFDDMARTFKRAETDHQAEKAIKWAEGALDAARRGAETDEPVWGSLAWKRKVAAKVRAADTSKAVGEIARVHEISRATAYRWANLYAADYGERDAA